MGEFTFKYNDVDVYFGVGTVSKRLLSVISGYVKALVVTSRTAARISGALEDVLRALEGAGVDYVIYDRVTPNPDTELADEATRLAELEGVDLVVAIGGGSVIDVAKTAAITANTGYSVVEFVRGIRHPRPGGPGLVVINLTHGTGSEVNRYAVLTVKETIEKRGFRARYPNASFDDPIYTRTLPRDQSLYTSIDAFYHAYESATSRNRNIMTISLAQVAVDHIRKALPKVIDEPQNIEVRSRLLYASMIAGISVDIAGGCHMIHALEHGFSGYNPALPHGAGLAILGPRIVYYTHKAVPDASAIIVKLLDPSVKPIPEDAERAMKAIESFQREVGFEKRLGDYGFSSNNVKEVIDFVEKTIAERYGANIPFHVTRSMIEEVVLSSI